MKRYPDQWSYVNPSNNNNIEEHGHIVLYVVSHLFVENDIEQVRQFLKKETNGWTVDVENKYDAVVYDATGQFVFRLVAEYFNRNENNNWVNV